MADLTPDQQLAAQLEFTGRAQTDIAETLGVHRSTLWKWRQTPEYQAEMAEMREEARRGVIAEAVKVRSNAIKVINAGVARMGQALGRGDMNAAEVATVTRAAVDVYKTVAAQTGIAEVTRVESSSSMQVVIAPDVAAAILATDDEESDR